MTDHVLGEKGRAFLADFFSGRPAKGDTRLTDPVLHFEETFVAPTALPMVVETIGNNLGETQLIVIDGHPRVGKTWFALAAIAKILDERPSVVAWHGGLDSRALFAAGSSPQSVYDALCRVETTVRSSAARLILLDDLFGTVTLRPLAKDQNDFSLLNAFFDDGDSEAGFRRRLPKGTTILLTARSVLLTAVEIVLGRRLRSSSALRISFGLFRRPDGSVGGTFNGTDLDEIFRRNETKGYVPPEMTALAPNAPREFLEDPRVPRVLFRPEFDALASLLARWSWTARKLNASDAETRLSALSRAYVLELASGLVFLGPAGYRALGIGDIAKALSDDLYIVHERGLKEFCRVPNEVYVRALRRHLSSAASIKTAVRAVQRVVSKKDLGIATRGLLELAISQVSLGEEAKSDFGLDDALSGLQDIPLELKDLVKECDDPLLHLESTGHLPDGVGPELIRKPGFCSAVGWALVKLPAFSIPSAQEVTSWIIGQLKTAFREWGESSPEQIDALLASYSTFLHWGVVMETEAEKNDLDACLKNHFKELDFLGALGRIVDDLEGDAARQVRMVLDDELIWACTALPSKSLPQHSLVSALRAALILEAASAAELDPFTIANRFFTLSWHTDEDGTALKDVLNDWRERWRDAAETAIKDDAGLIDTNLQYHWWHFLTQHGVWMRDWCVTAEDPLRLEKNRPASGSRDPEGNRDFWRVVQWASASHQDKNRHQRFRDCLMLVGTRSARFSPDCDPLMLFKQAESDPDLGPAAVEAIFELSRANYLATSTAVGLARETNETGPNVSGSFREWCRRIYSNQEQKAVKDAWARYRSELKKVTHLDVLPDHRNEVLPEGW